MTRGLDWANPDHDLIATNSSKCLNYITYEEKHCKDCVQQYANEQAKLQNSFITVRDRERKRETS